MYSVKCTFGSDSSDSYDKTADEDKENSSNIQNDESNLEYFKTQLKNVNSKISSTRKKIIYLRKVYQQFAMLINKMTVDNYGSIEKTKKIERPFPIPSPQPNPEINSQLIHLLTQTESVSSTDVVKFVNDFSIVEQIILTNKSAFDEKLLQVLSMSTPAIRVAFFNAVCNKLIRCNTFIAKLLPVLSKISLHPALRRQYSNADADFNDFFTFFEDSKKKIGDLIGFEKVLILFVSNDGKDFIYPTKSFDHIIDVNSTLLGSLLKSPTPVITKCPLDDSRLLRGEERCVFETNSTIISCRFSYESKPENGLVIAFSDREVTDSDSILMQLVVEYISPALNLMSNMFNNLYPSAIANLLLKISELYESVNPIEGSKLIINKLLDASVTKILALKQSDEFPEIPVLPEGRSLIRTVIESGKPQVIRLPRLRSDFSKEIDDDLSLSKITAVYITKIDCQNLISVSYNCNKSNGFPPKNILLVESFIKAIPKVVETFLVKKNLEKSSTFSLSEGEMIEKFFKTIPKILKGAQDLDFFDKISEIFDNKLTFEICSLTEDNSYYVFPSEEYRDLPPEIDEIKSPTILQDNESKTLVIPSNDQEMFMLVTGDFESFDQNFIKYVSSAGMTIFRFYLMEYNINDLINRQSYIRGASRLDIGSISNLLDYNLTLDIFDQPKREDELNNENKFVMPIHTNKGIEAVIYCDESIDDEVSNKVLNSYAEWISAALSFRIQCKEVPDDIFAEFKKLNLELIFGCNDEKLIFWLKNVISLFMTNDIDYHMNLEYMKNVELFFEKLSQGIWFTEKEKIIISIISFFEGLEKIWRIKCDDYLIKVCSKISVIATPTVAILFNKVFGLGCNLSIEDAKDISNMISKFKCGTTMINQIEVVANIRRISDNDWVQCEENKVWVGRSLILLKRVLIWKGEGITHKQLVEKEPNINIKKEITYAERICLPIATYLSTRNEFLLTSIRNVRNNIRNIKFE